ncbi:unnamed protein product, partial [Ectocarpus sp. 4 AP-2014]
DDAGVEERRRSGVSGLVAVRWDVFRGFVVRRATHRVRAGRRAHVLPGAAANAPRLSRVATSWGGGYRWSSANGPRPTTGKGKRCPCGERRCCGEGAHEWWDSRELLERKGPESRDKHGVSSIRSNSSSSCR